MNDDHRGREKIKKTVSHENDNNGEKSDDDYDVLSR